MSELPFVRESIPLTEEDKLCLQELCYHDKEIQRLYDFDMFCRVYNLTDKQRESCSRVILGRKKDRNGSKRLFNKLMEYYKMVSSICIKKDYDPIESMKELKELENENENNT